MSFRGVILLLGAFAAQFASGQNPLPLRQSHYRLRAGESVALDAPPETVAFVRDAAIRSVTPSRFVLTVSEDGSSLRLTAPLTMPPGQYAVTVSAAGADAVVIGAALTVTLDPMTPVPSSATKPPVVLLNGFQLFGCSPSNTIPHSKATFGSLEAQLLGDGVPIVFFFDNCVEAPDAKIEDLGNALMQFMNLIKDDHGALVPRVDLVGHSMGGLIARAYMAGLQSDGSLAPPANPRVRKLVMIATPNFGSFLAGQYSLILGAQGAEMEPGSAFLWSLNRWNQFTDDLRGVDALAIAGNAGLSPQSNASDGVVSLTSSSLGFARDTSHTRILPYCHTDELAIVGCPASSIANADEAPETAQIVRSFLADTSAWRAIGTTSTQDPWLSQYGGMYFALENAAGTQYFNDLTAVSWGSVNLLNGQATKAIFYNEFVKGTGTFQSNSASIGTTSCGSFTEPAGYYSTIRCKFSPQIYSVGPFVTGTAAAYGAKLVLPGAGGAITITGTGFGPQRCATCSVTATPGGALQISSWTDTSITAQLPSATAGLVQLAVQAANGGDSINVLLPVLTGGISALVVTSVTNAASGATGTIAPGEMVTIKGAGLGPSSGLSFSLDQTTRTVATTLAGVQVLFGGVAAPITYASATQVNAIVPYEIAGSQLTMTVQYQGASSQAVTLQVAAAAPGVFTFNFTGAGQAVAANQDGSLNGPAGNGPAGSGPYSPAPKGSYVVIYFTGGGQSEPAGATGSVNSLTTLKQFSNVTATVGGQPVAVTFAGAAPGLVDGVCQLNMRLPANIATGNALPLVVAIGGVASPATAALAVQ